MWLKITDNKRLGLIQLRKFQVKSSQRSFVVLYIDCCCLAPNRTLDYKAWDGELEKKETIFSMHEMKGYFWGQPLMSHNKRQIYQHATCPWGWVTLSPHSHSSLKIILDNTSITLLCLHIFYIQNCALKIFITMHESIGSSPCNSRYIYLIQLVFSWSKLRWKCRLGRSCLEILGVQSNLIRK